jgi:TadE-like protein
MRCRSGMRNRRGSVAVEMAIVLPFLMVMIYAIVELGRLLYMVAALNYAVERASRCAAIGAAECSGSAPNTPQCYAASWALGLGLTCSDFSYTPPSTSPAGPCSDPASGTAVAGALVSTNRSFQSPVLQLLPDGQSLTIPLRARSCFPV